MQAFTMYVLRAMQIYAVASTGEWVLHLKFPKCRALDEKSAIQRKHACVYKRIYMCLSVWVCQSITGILLGFTLLIFNAGFGWFKGKSAKLFDAKSVCKLIAIFFI